MNHLDAHGLLKQALLRGNHGARKSGDKLTFRCPRHGDGTASAWMGTHAWGCSACGFTEGLPSLADQLGVTLPDTAQQGQGLTVAEYAERKGLALDKLAAFGVEDRVGRYGEAMVAIPYRDADGKVLRTKLRTRSKTFWDRDGVGTPLYGLDRLAASRGPVLIVEGESDCHAAWQRGVAAVGVPGASAFKLDAALVFSGRDVLVWQEPDEGGATLVASVAKALPKAKVIRDVKVNGVAMKDVGDLHQAVQQGGLVWAEVWRGIVSTATPIGAEPPVVAFDSLSGDTLEQILSAKLAPIDSVPTPIPAWNAVCGGGGGRLGLARGWLVTIGANTGTGKSLIGLNLAASAIQHGEVVTFISLEMGRDELATRLLSIVSDESVEHLEQGPRFDAGAYTRAGLTLDGIRQQTGGHVLVNRKPINKLADIASAFRYHVEVHGCRYFIVDYLQLAWTSPSHTDHERVTQVAHTLRELTATHGTVTVALSQFNRQTSGNRSERPVAQGLMGGSAIENDSHQVLLFDHSRFTRTGNLADTWLIVDKNRHGAVLDVPVQWDYRTLRLHPRDPSTPSSTVPRFPPPISRRLAPPPAEAAADDEPWPSATPSTRTSRPSGMRSTPAPASATRAPDAEHSSAAPSNRNGASSTPAPTASDPMMDLPF